MRTVISCLFLLMMTVGANAQSIAENELLLKKWKLKKAYVNGEKNDDKLVNDHLIFTKEKFKSFDEGDAAQRFVMVGRWNFDPSKKFIILNPGTPNESTYKILKLYQNNLVYQMELAKKSWEIHMKSED